jgi:hypothetical protein
LRTKKTGALLNFLIQGIGDFLFDDLNLCVLSVSAAPNVHRRGAENAEKSISE